MRESQLTEQIIGAAIEVHRLLGPGLLESAYEECLAREFTLRKIPFERQRPVEALAPVHDAIVLTYLRLSGCKVGLLINFYVSLLKDGIKRFVYDPPTSGRDEGFNTGDTEKQRARRTEP